MREESLIQSFFRGRHVLVTGGSGFLGQALLEKLLRCCPDVGSVQLLLRPQRGLDASQRLHQLLRSPVFERVRAQHPEALHKVKPVNGDVTKEKLGISSDDCRFLQESVSVVFHSAATVSFNETLRLAVELNCCGTKRLLQLCKDMPHLQAFVHVSTAYTNADKPGQEIAEELYPPPADPESVMEACGSPSISDGDLQELFGAALRRFPNTYTFSKALAEDVVARAAVAPTAIVRPSIVTGAVSEPFPGWVLSPSGITGLLAGIAHGSLREILCKESFVLDIVPVDYVVNTLIAAAWHTATGSVKQVTIFNNTSASCNSITLGETVRLANKYANKYPTSSALWYPKLTIYQNKLRKKIDNLLVTVPLAFIADIILSLQGVNPKLVKTIRRLEILANSVDYFLNNEWKFCSNNIHTIVCDSRDKVMFYTDLSQVNWDQYFDIYLSGIRRYTFKEEPNTLASAQKKLQRQYFCHRLIQGIKVSFVAYTIYALYGYASKTTAKSC